MRDAQTVTTKGNQLSSHPGAYAHYMERPGKRLCVLELLFPPRSSFLFKLNYLVHQLNPVVIQCHYTLAM